MGEVFVEVRSIVHKMQHDPSNSTVTSVRDLLFDFRLMGRLQDLDRPLQIVNRSLWEEISSFSEEEVLEDFLIVAKSYV